MLDARRRPPRCPRAEEPTPDEASATPGIRYLDLLAQRHVDEPEGEA
ncbi:MAG: hypothetical protein MI919_32280 [Holophagales bacterium]|nr:hypothetical protein [Holophagales bacterium]